MTDNAILDKSLYFACKIIRFAEELKERHCFEIAQQVL